MKNLSNKISMQNSFEIQSLPIFPTKNMLIELSNICNHKCIFCANKKMTRKKGYMDFNFLKRILYEAYNEGTREVGFYATGEPLIYPNLIKAVSLAKEIGYEYVYITTNGALLNQEKIHALIDAKIDSIKFSINGGSPETYKFIHGADDFNLVISNLKLLRNIREEKQEHHLNIYVSFVATRFTEHEIDDFKKKYEQYCNEIIFVKVGNQGGLNSESIKQLECQTSNPLFIETKCKLPCARLFNGLTITWEGYLSACCVDFENQLIIANLNQSHIRDAWQSKAFQRLRLAHINNTIEGTMCFNCVNNSMTPFNPINSDYSHQIDFSKLYKHVIA